MDRILRTIIPLSVGYLTYIISDNIFESIFPVNPIDDSSSPGFVLLFVEVFNFFWTISIILFQYFSIVPRTLVSIKKVALMTIFVGICLGLLFGIGHYYVDNASIEKSLISFSRITVQFESFFLTNISIIGLFNFIRNSRTNIHHKEEE